jgi:ubiquitin-protein ligase
MQNKKLTTKRIGELTLFSFALFILGIVLVVGYFFVSGFFTPSDAPGNLYTTKGEMCIDFAQSYLKTIQKTENIHDYGSEKWKVAIDIETEIYNICRLDLTNNSVSTYQQKALQKYRN